MHKGKIEGRILYINEDNNIVTYQHCCDQMQFHIKEKEKIIIFIPEFREYAIRVSRSIIQCISYCPWCGKKLPPNLRDKFFEVLNEEYNLDIGIAEISEAPKEFQSDEWWRKRGL